MRYSLIHTEVHTAKLNLELQKLFLFTLRCIDCIVNSKINSLPSILLPPYQLFSVASSTNSIIASLWICISTVYKPCTVFLAHQCLLVQIHPHLPMNGKNNVHLFNGVSWNRGKWKAGSQWGLNPGPWARTANNWPLSCNHQITTRSCNPLLCRYWMLYSYTSDVGLHKHWQTDNNDKPWQ